MAEFFDRLFGSEEADSIFGYVLIFGIGAFFYIMNWVIFFNNLDPKKKWVSMVPPLGGMLIAVGLLIAGLGWWALVGLTDPWIWSLVWALLAWRFGEPKKTDKEDKNDNGD